MDVSAIKPDLVVHARPLETMPIPQDVHIGRVDHVEGNYIKLAKNHSEDGSHHWVPLTWVEAVTDKGVFLNKNVEEYLWGRLDENPIH